MNDLDKTENLLEPSNQTKKSSKKKWLIPVIVIVVLLLVGGGVGGYYLYNQSELNKNLELGQKYLEEGDYENAIIAFEDASHISDKNPEIFQGLAQAYLATGNNEKAQQAYQKLSELTNEPKYQYYADTAVSGNSIGNLSNDGYIAVQGNDTYITQLTREDMVLWKKTDGKMSLIGNLPYGRHASYAPPTELNIWGDQAFYKDSGIVLYSFNLENQEATNNAASTKNVLTYQIYKGKIYYLQYDNTKDDPLLISTDTSGGNSKTYDMSEIPLHPYDLFITNDLIFIYASTGTGDSSGLYSIGLEDNTVEKIHEDSKPIEHYAVFNNKLYYSIKDSTIVNVYDLKDETQTEINLNEPFKAMNVYGNSIFYISGNSLNKWDIDAGEKQKISTVESSGTDPWFTIGIGSNEIFVTVSENTNSSGQELSYYSAPLDDLDSFGPLNFSLLNSYSGTTDELKAAYKDQVSRVYSEELAKYPEAYKEYLCDYYIFDINNDDTPELIVRTGNAEANYGFNYYTFKDGKAKLIGQTNGGHTGLEGEDNILNGKLIEYMGHMGGYSIKEVSMDKNGQIVENTIDEGSTQGDYPDNGYVELPYHYAIDLSMFD